MKNLVVLSGSGISAESGISTFRGGNGLWDNVPVQEICTPEGWMANPGKVLEFYNERRAQLSAVEPNQAHKIIVELEKDFNVNVITQNVDNLHERAGSKNVLHLHGELTKVRPEDCYCEDDYYSTAEVMDIGYRRVTLGETGGPHNKQLRPHIVWFGEAVPNLDSATRIVYKADILLVIGTSMQVYPAAMLHQYAPATCRLFIVDPEDAPAVAIRGVTHIKAVATEGMRQFREMINRE